MIIQRETRSFDRFFRSKGENKKKKKKRILGSNLTRCRISRHFHGSCLGANKAVEGNIPRFLADGSYPAALSIAASLGRMQFVCESALNRLRPALFDSGPGVTDKQEN